MNIASKNVPHHVAVLRSSLKLLILARQEDTGCVQPCRPLPLPPCRPRTTAPSAAPPSSPHPSACRRPSVPVERHGGSMARRHCARRHRHMELAVTIVLMSSSPHHRRRRTRPPPSPVRRPSAPRRPSWRHCHSATRWILIHGASRRGMARHPSHASSPIARRMHRTPVALSTPPARSRNTKNA